MEKQVSAKAVHKREYNSERRRKPNTVIPFTSNSLIRENITPRGDGNFRLSICWGLNLNIK